MSGAPLCLTSFMEVKIISEKVTLRVANTILRNKIYLNETSFVNNVQCLMSFILEDCQCES